MGWSQRANCPLGVGAGGALVKAYSSLVGDTVIFGHPGLGNTSNFYYYRIGINSWTTCQFPSTYFRGGAALAWIFQDTILGFRGGNDNRYRFYSIRNNSWGGVNNLPYYADSGATATRAIIDGNCYVFAMFGKGQKYFRRYNPYNATWEVYPDFPVSTGWGTSIAAMKGDTIFALAGMNRPYFYMYAGGTWIPGPNIPQSVWRGGALVFNGQDKLFALSGRHASGSLHRSFWCYDFRTGIWFSKPSIPVDVDSGGALVYAYDSVFAFVGGGSNRFYRYAEPTLSSNFKTATAFNQGRHLTRRPGTNELHITYECHGVVYYSMSTNNGLTWTYPELVDKGTNPCIILDPGNNISPWIAYVNNYSIIQAIRTSPGVWQKRTVYTGSGSQKYAEMPSMASGINPTGPEACAYIVYKVYDYIGHPTRPYTIYFNRIYSWGFAPPENIDGWTTTILQTPSIAVTPGDIIHVVWRRTNPDRIIYRENRNFQWSDTFRVSTPQSPASEPAYNPFIEAYGDSAFAVWCGKPTGNQGDIYRRGKGVIDPYYIWQSSPWLVEATPSTESNYPVMSTRYAVAWPDSMAGSFNKDIRGWINGTPVWLYQSPAPSTYPHIYVWESAAQTPVLYGIETEQLFRDTLYEVRCFSYDIISTDALGFYAVATGEENPSPYCQRRDGYARVGNYKFDYGNQELIYNLPYLNPHYDYLIRAIVYQNNTPRFRQAFTIDDSLMAEIDFEPERPETVKIKIPRNLYRKDCKVVLRVAKKTGTYAVISKIDIFQLEPDGEGRGGGQTGRIEAAIKTAFLESPSILSRGKVQIKYQIGSESRINLVIYDISGRIVKSLFTGRQKPGTYTLVWDCNDTSRGIYFCTLTADNILNTKKITLIK